MSDKELTTLGLIAGPVISIAASLLAANEAVADVAYLIPVFIFGGLIFLSSLISRSV